MTLDLELSKTCDKFCGYFKDCYKEYFHLDERRIKEDYLENYYICLICPTSSNTIIRHLPKIYLEEFLCFMASILSLWFGFSVIMLTDVCLLFIKNMNNLIFKLKANFIIVKLNVRLGQTRNPQLGND